MSRKQDFFESLNNIVLDKCLIHRHLFLTIVFSDILASSSSRVPHIHAISFCTEEDILSRHSFGAKSHGTVLALIVARAILWLMAEVGLPLWGVTGWDSRLKAVCRPRFLLCQSCFADVVSCFADVVSFAGRRPARRRASSMSHWSWPLIERNSSAAHFSRASIVVASMRSTKLLVFGCSFVILFFFCYW